MNINLLLGLKRRIHGYFFRLPSIQFLPCIERILKRPVTSVSLLGLGLFSLSGCDGISSGTPSCTDSDVVDLVKQIATDPMGTQLAGKYAAEALKRQDGTLFNIFAQYPRLGYKEWKENPPIQSDPMQTLMANIDQDLAAMKVGAIRTTEMNEQVGKMSCGAQIEVPKLRPFNVEYTVQYTEDGQIWVEVYGLPQ